MIPYNKLSNDRKDINFVSKSLTEKLITTGPTNQKFENLIKKKFQCKFASIVSSGTAALHLSFLSINIKKNDIVIMPSINFISSFNLCQSLGARIYLADVDKITGQMTPETLIECIKINKIRKIKAVITMYLGGAGNHLQNFYNLKNKYKFFLIEDACHALGSKYLFNKKKHTIGSSKHSDICVFSLHAIKAITTGEGGIVCTNNKNLFKEINLLKSHGIKRDKYNRHWKYDVVKNGLNYRLSDINCALGVSQLSKLDSFIKKRKTLARNYIKLFRNNKFISFAASSMLSSYHLFIISIDFHKLKKNKEFFLRYLKNNNILAQFHYIPIYKFSVYGKKKISLKNSEYYYLNSVSIPLYYDLSKKDQKYVARKIIAFIDKYRNEK